MGRTLEDIMSEEFGFLDQPGGEKTASADAQPADTSDDIEKLAAEIGLEMGQPGAENQDPEGAQPGAQGSETVKEASSMDLGSLYTDMFPEDTGILASEEEKTAAAEKTAAQEKEAAMGAAAYDSFAVCVDRHIEKLAESLTGDATVSTSVNETEDGKPAQTVQMKDNQPANSDQKINTDPQITDEVTAKPGDGKVVGTQTQTAPAGNGETEKQASLAFQKALLLANLDTTDGGQ